jgi:hypothetical protein
MRKQTSEMLLNHRRPRRSRDLIFLAACSLPALSACTAMNRPPAVTPPPLRSSDTHPPQHANPIKPRKAPSRDVPSRDTHASQPAPARTASIDPKSLMGLDPDGVQKRLGTPARMQNTSLSREWVYDAPGCSFSIFFYPNVNSTSFRALKYGSAKDNGENLDSSDACVRKILTARNNDDNN